MVINMIGQERLDRLSAILAYLGGNPCIITSAWHMIDGLPARRWDVDSRADYLVSEIADLRQEIDDNVALIERARAHRPNHWDRVVLAAFEAGKAMYPATFEYGMGAGNYRTDLVTDGRNLYRTRSVQGRDYGQRLEKIATREVI